MAGYSGTPLPKKLGIKASHRVLLVNPPQSFRATLGELPEDTVLADWDQTQSLDLHSWNVILFFVRDKSMMSGSFDLLKKALTWDGGLWIAFIKQASKLKSELRGATVRELGLSRGLVDNKICAIDADWSGLRFVYRTEDRPPKRRRKRP